MQNIPIDVVRHIISFLDYESRMNANLIFLDNPNDRVVKSIKKDAMKHEIHCIKTTIAMYTNNVNEAHYIESAKVSIRIKLKNTISLFKYLIKKGNLIGYLGIKFVTACKLKVTEILIEAQTLIHIRRKYKRILTKLSNELLSVVNNLTYIKDTDLIYKAIKVI